jgi:hypothetical protein
MTKTQLALARLRRFNRLLTTEWQEVSRQGGLYRYRIRRVKPCP